MHAIGRDDPQSLSRPCPAAGPSQQAHKTAQVTVRHRSVRGHEGFASLVVNVHPFPVIVAHVYCSKLDLTTMRLVARRLPLPAPDDHVKHDNCSDSSDDSNGRNVHGVSSTIYGILSKPTCFAQPCFTSGSRSPY